jgi:hypothetical protein
MNILRQKKGGNTARKTFAVPSIFYLFYACFYSKAATFSFPCSGGVFLPWVSFLFAKANVSIEIIGSGQRRQNPGCRMLCFA